MSLPTEITVLDATPIEYRIERQSHRIVVFFHGGHMHEGIALFLWYSSRDGARAATLSARVTNLFR